LSTRAPFVECSSKRNARLASQPWHNAQCGVTKVVDRHVAPDGAEGYSIEVFNALGDTIAVTVVPAAALEPLREDEVLCARTRGTA